MLVHEYGPSAHSHAACQCHSTCPPAVVALGCAPSTPSPAHHQQLDAVARAPSGPYHRAIGALASAPWAPSYADGRRCQPRVAVIIALTSSTPSSAHHVECCCPRAIIALPVRRRLACTPSVPWSRAVGVAGHPRHRRPLTLGTLIRASTDRGDDRDIS